MRKRRSLVVWGLAFRVFRVYSGYIGIMEKKMETTIA